MQRITLPRIGTAAAWRDAARGLVAQGVPPSEISWGDRPGARGLFDLDAAPAAQPGAAVSVPRSFVALADTVVWHTDPARFDRLYALLWRLRGAPHLMADRADPDVAALRAMEKNVRRCQHKMKAFVRFRDIGATDAGRRQFAAWFEPTHHTVEPTAGFFARRFADMDWRIVTPDVTAIFEAGALRFELDHPRPDLPQDAHEELWTTYFRNIFNPARLKVAAMQSEMPRKYWKNLPEAAAIPEMIAEAPARVRAMAEAQATAEPVRAAAARRQFARFESAWQADGGLAACTRCSLHRTATQAVPGEGPRDAGLMIVGEQPGDAEDLTGRPFVGPAGQVLDRAMIAAGLEREAIYLTNAVKHFKFRAQGKRRLHQRPDAGEVAQCKWWLEAELAEVRPHLIVAMGASAALALTGSGQRIGDRRGAVEQPGGLPPVLITWHPSYILRGPDAETRARAEAEFAADLALAARLSQPDATPQAAG